MAKAGKSVGAVYKPEGEIVPDAAFPPAIPLTPQMTELLLLPLTVAASCNVFPSNTFALGGVTTTVMVGGGGGRVPELAPPPPQPGKVAKAANNNANSKPLA